MWQKHRRAKICVKLSQDELELEKRCTSHRGLQGAQLLGTIRVRKQPRQQQLFDNFRKMLVKIRKGLQSSRVRDHHFSKPTQTSSTGTIHWNTQPFINKPRECFCLFLSFSDILGICGNLSCLYNKATAPCLWHHIHGNPNIACTGN